MCHYVKESGKHGFNNENGCTLRHTISHLAAIIGQTQVLLLFCDAVPEWAGESGARR
jgi:hypothetical protein